MPQPVTSSVALAVVALCLCAPAQAGLSIFEYSKLANLTTPSTSPSPSVAASTTTAPPSTTASATPTSNAEMEAEEAEEQDCRDQIGTIQNGVPVNTMRSYDVETILEGLGGAPGKLNVTWNKDVPELPMLEDPKEDVPADTENSTFWLYDYRSTDSKSFVRLEHALLRHKGQPDEYVDIRGELYWTPPDFCNKSRHATYRSNPHEGFKADVTLEYCNFGTDSIWCAFPASCQSNATHIACVAAPTSALLATLVG